MGIGYGLDLLFGSLPVCLIIFALLGFAAGIKTMLRTADQMKKQEDTGTPGSSDGGE